MALLSLNLRKSFANILQIRRSGVYERNFNTTFLLCLNQRWSRPATYKEKEKRFLMKDKVPENYGLIYKAPMESYVAWATHVSTVTASLICASACFQFLTNKPILEPIGTTLTMESVDIYYFAVGFLAINTMLRLVVSMFPLRIYKDKRKYLAVYHSQVPLTTSHHVFERGQVKPAFSLLSPWNNVTYMLGSKKSLVFEDYFKTPSEFHEMRDTNVKK